MSKNSKTIEISSALQFNTLLASSKAVVADFYADWCGPCKAIAPLFEDFSATYSRKDLVTFAKVNTDKLADVAAKYSVSALPTLIYFENEKEHTRIQGSSKQELTKLIDRWKAIGSGAEGAGNSSSASTWNGASLPRGMADVTEQVDIKGLEIRNNDSEFGNARTLVDVSKPSSLGSGKAKAASGSSDGAKDWVESDTDPELMIHMPFQSTLKIHSLQITSVVPEDVDEDDDETPMRPKTLKLFINRPNIVGFDEDIEPTQEVTIQDSDWQDHTATVPLRYVKFQKVSTLCIFVVEGNRNAEKTRIDRIRIIGESGEKRDMGKLEKIGDEAGE
ncbi:thioredoxin [Verruconis gallopava]|uniref:Thioredoxin n=1 Tax=Verruconis gallopava TaxID=253628 RepID=A0A0D1XLJ2_9PEZI|nr:thioredoxin [Verruconis gallopava]KIW03296.1 thioredoxin [Verruconis gallopava]